MQKNKIFSYNNFCDHFLSKDTQSPIQDETGRGNNKNDTKMPIQQFGNVDWSDFFYSLLGRPKVELFNGNMAADFFSIDYMPNRISNHHCKFMNGWKFHISINDNRGKLDNLAKAWDLIKDILIKHKVQAFKVVIPNALFAEGDEKKQQYGKQITIHQYQDERANQPDFWQKVLQEIESQLQLANIEPDPNANKNHDFNIEGSRYISYRNDAQMSHPYLVYARCMQYFQNIPQARKVNYSIFDSLSPVEALSKNLFPENSLSIGAIASLLAEKYSSFRLPVTSEREFFQAIDAMSNDYKEHFIMHFNTFCETPEGLYSQSLQPNAAGFHDPFRNIILHRPTWVDTVLHCCSANRNAAYGVTFESKMRIAEVKESQSTTAIVNTTLVSSSSSSSGEIKKEILKDEHENHDDRDKEDKHELYEKFKSNSPKKMNSSNAQNLNNTRSSIL